MAAPSVTYTFVNGAVADASQVNQNFTDLVNALTGSYDLTIGTIVKSGEASTGMDITLREGIALGYDATATSYGGLRFTNGVIGGNGYRHASQYGIFLGANCYPSSGDGELDPFGTTPATFIAIDANVVDGSWVTFGLYADGGQTPVAPYDTLNWGSSGSGTRGDLYSGLDSWTDYSGTTTVIGWNSGTSTVDVFYKRIGKIVYVNFDISGTSEATTASFTLPMGYYPASGSTVHAACFGQDNGVDLENPCYVTSTPADSTFSVYKTYPSGVWTASGNKVTKGQFWFEMA